MTPEKQRVAIAEECGWRLSDFVDKSMKAEALNCWISPGGSDWQMTTLPDYLNDLNEMRQAEKVLTRSVREWSEYEYYLRNTTLRDGREGGGLYERLILATATQRAEAFLRALVKWEES